MREKLINKENNTIMVTGIYTKKSSYKENNKFKKSYLFNNITDRITGQEITNHVWLSQDNFDRIDLEKLSNNKNCTFKFNAVVKVYYKIYKGKKVKDYCLTNIQGVEKL